MADTKQQEFDPNAPLNVVIKRPLTQAEIAITIAIDDLRKMREHNEEPMFDQAAVLLTQAREKIEAVMDGHYFPGTRPKR